MHSAASRPSLGLADALLDTQAPLCSLGDESIPPAWEAHPGDDTCSQGFGMNDDDTCSQGFGVGLNDDVGLDCIVHRYPCAPNEYENSLNIMDMHN